MSKMSNLCLLIGEIIEHGEAILEATREIRSIFTDEPPMLPDKPAAKEEKKPAAKEPEKELAFTDVRAKLAELSKAGHTAQIKEILKRHGAEKLSDIRPEDYGEILKEAEGLANG